MAGRRFGLKSLNRVASNLRVAGRPVIRQAISASEKRCVLVFRACTDLMGDCNKKK